MKNILRSTHGAAAVEFALIAPLLFVLVFGIIEFSALLYNKAVITNASREGARFAASYYTNPANGTSTRPTCNEIKTYVVTYVQKHFLNFTSNSSFGVGNITCPTGTDTYINYGGTAGYVDTITITYNYQFLVFGELVKLIGEPIPSSITLTAVTAMRSENQTAAAS